MTELLTVIHKCNGERSFQKLGDLVLRDGEIPVVIRQLIQDVKHILRQLLIRDIPRLRYIIRRLLIVVDQNLLAALHSHFLIGFGAVLVNQFRRNRTVEDGYLRVFHTVLLVYTYIEDRSTHGHGGVRCIYLIGGILRQFVPDIICDTALYKLDLCPAVL